MAPDFYIEYLDSLKGELVEVDSTTYLFNGRGREKARNAFTYDNGPLRGIVPGSCFHARLDTSVNLMTSKLTGAEWRMHDTSCALSRDGRVFGNIHAYQLLDLRKALREKRKALLLSCFCDEWYEEGWPEVMVCFDTGSRIEKIAEIFRNYGKWPVDSKLVAADEDRRAEDEERARLKGRIEEGAEEITEFFLTLKDGRMTEFLGRHTRWDGVCDVRERPPAKGSHAKPKPWLEFDGEEVYVSRVTRAEYDIMNRNVGGRLRVSTRLVDDDDGRTYMTVVLSTPADASIPASS